MVMLRNRACATITSCWQIRENNKDNPQSAGGPYFFMQASVNITVLDRMHDIAVADIYGIW